MNVNANVLDVAIKSENLGYVYRDNPVHFNYT